MSLYQYQIGQIPRPNRSKKTKGTTGDIYKERGGDFKEGIRGKSIHTA